MRPGDAPGPVVRRRHQPRPHRVELDVARGRQHMRRVEHAGRKPPLPQMPDPALAPVHRLGVAPMRLAQRPPEAGRVAGHQQQMHMVGLPAPGPDCYLAPQAPLCQQPTIELIVGIAEEGRLPPVVPQRHMQGTPATTARAKRAIRVGYLWLQLIVNFVGVPLFSRGVSLTTNPRGPKL